MKPEAPLIIEGASGSFGAGSSGISSAPSTAPTSTAAPQ
jgi:hypothetical protein